MTNNMTTLITLISKVFPHTTLYIITLVLIDGIQYLAKIKPTVHLFKLASVRTIRLLQFNAFFQNKILR